MSLKKLSAAFVVILLMVVAAPKAASAATIGFTCLTDNTGNCSDYDQFFGGTVNVVGNQLTATIFNIGSDGVIGQVYADFPDASLATYQFTSVIEGPGTDYDNVPPFTANPSDLPASNNANPDFDTDFRTGAESPAPDNGAQSGQFVQLIWTLTAGQTQADIDALLLSGGIRFGLHVISLGDGEDSEALISQGNCPDCTPTTTSTVPEPASMLLLGTGLLAAARARRRKKTS